MNRKGDVLGISIIVVTVLLIASVGTIMYIDYSKPTISVQNIDFSDKKTEDVAQQTAVQTEPVKNTSAEKKTEENISPKSICTDSDDGKDYFKAGFVNVSGEMYGDYCQKENQVNQIVEYYCASYGEGVMKQTTIVYDCPFSCYQRACTESKLTQEVISEETIELTQNFEPFDPSKIDADVTVKVLVVRYVPYVEKIGERYFDIALTGDFGDKVDTTLAKLQQIEDSTARAHTEATKYRGYANQDSKPYLKYEIIERINRFKDVELVQSKLPERWIDHNNTMLENDVCHYVDDLGVREIWIWANWPALKGHSESKMSSKYGDVSNSYRLNDMPICDHTYVMYNYNPNAAWASTVPEFWADEDHMHQFESQFMDLDYNLYNLFVGPVDDKSKPQRCGWSHVPPNTDNAHQYDWGNKNYIETDCKDWNPQGTGEKKTFNCNEWGCNGFGWFMLWMQSIPGKDNGLTYEGKTIRNFWEFVGDYDSAMEKGRCLVC